MILLVIMRDEVVEIELCGQHRTYLPKQESSDWVAPHQAVEETTDLVCPPNEFALNRRQHVVTTMNPVKHFRDWNGGLPNGRGLKPGTALTLWPGPKAELTQPTVTKADAPSP